MRRLRDRGGPEGTRYTMREKIFSVGDDFWIETEGGERAFKVNGKALRVRETLVLESRSGDELLTIQEKKLSVRDKMEVERSGKTVATVKKALVGIRDRYSIEVEGSSDLSAKGNIVDHEYEIERDGDKVAEVSKRWFRVRDAYGIEVAPDQDDALILAVAVCIDQMGRATEVRAGPRRDNHDQDPSRAKYSRGRVGSGATGSGASCGAGAACERPGSSWCMCSRPSRSASRCRGYRLGSRSPAAV